MNKHTQNVLFLGIGISLAFLLPSTVMKWCLGILVFLIFSIRLAVGISVIRYNYFLKAIHQVPDNRVLLTFDDGPHPIHTPQILEILHRHNVGAIFFVIGNKIEGNERIINALIDSGHLVANHTFSHPHQFALLSTKKVISEIVKGQKSLDSIKKSSPQLFRTPIGVTNPNIARAIRKTKVTPIGWSLRTLDTRAQSKTWVNQLVSKTKKGDIVLFHDTQKQTVEQLETYILQLKENGIEFVNTSHIKELFHV